MAPRFHLGYQMPARTIRGLPPSSRAASRAGGRRSSWRLLTRPVTWINLALVGVVLGELAAGMRVMARPLPPPDVVAPLSGPAEAIAESASVEPVAVPETTSLASLASRPLFHAEDDQSRSATPAAAQTPTLSDQTKGWAMRLCVLGVMAGSVPQAVLEDAQTKKTYVVTIGQRILDGLLVKDIRAGRVILDLQGETIELSL